MTQRRRPRYLLALAAGAALSAAAVNATSELRIIDGDTVAQGWRIRLEEARYRLAGIDAPETRGAKCAGERALGRKAALRLRGLVAGGRVVLATQVAKDKYGRQIASLSHDGRDVAETLVAEGLARHYNGRSRRDGWCQTKNTPAAGPRGEGPTTGAYKRSTAVRARVRYPVM